MASARERHCFYSDSVSSLQLFVTHRAGIQAALTILFIFKMGQKEARYYWLQNVDVAAEDGGANSTGNAESVRLGLSQQGWRPSSKPA